MKLTIVGLPLGNAQDISHRALEAISEAKLVVCEDTRVISKLYQKLISLGLINHPFTGEYLVINDYNEKDKQGLAMARLTQVGEAILVSDAGLPTISDPGYVLVNAVYDAGGQVDIIPGPTAAMNALALSGFSADKALFLGFLPQKGSKRKKNLELLKGLIGQGITAIIYESPYKLNRTVTELEANLGDLPCVIVKELTKAHQQVSRGTLTSLIQPSTIHKGEHVLLIRL